MLTDAEIATLVGAVVILVNVLAAYIQNQKSATRDAATHAKVDAVAQAVQAPPALVDGHAIPPADSLSATTPLPPRG